MTSDSLVPKTFPGSSFSVSKNVKPEKAWKGGQISDLATSKLKLESEKPHFICHIYIVYESILSPTLGVGIYFVSEVDMPQQALGSC